MTRRRRIVGINPRTGKPFQKGDLRVWYIVNAPSFDNHIYVDNIEEAMRVIDYIVEVWSEDQNIDDYLIGLEWFELWDDELLWSEWYDEETGEEILEYMERVK